jgi:hypothetical protein
MARLSLGDGLKAAVFEARQVAKKLSPETNFYGFASSLTAVKRGFAQ